MQQAVPELLESVPAVYVAVGVVAAVFVATQLSKRPNLSAFPTAVSGGWLGSWWASIKYMTGAEDIIQEGYRKHKGVPFKVAAFSHWLVVVTKRAHIEEMRNARDDEFSFMEATNEDLNSEFTMGTEVYENPYHIRVMRSQLTRNLGTLYSELRDEIITALDEILDLKDNGDMFPDIKINKSLTMDDLEWKSIPALTTVQQVVCRASNRSFVGLPLCRNQDYVDLNIQFTVDAFTGGLLIALFPKILRPLAARFVTNVPRNTRRGVRHLRPIIEERRKYINEYGKDWTEKPHDLLSWLIDEGGPDATVETLTNRVLATNFAAIHTSSNVFTTVLYNLAANPQYAQPLREEVQAIVEEEGWSKASVGKMRKVDSFLKESVRMEGIDNLGLTRKAYKDYTFSDGTLIPKGTRINAGLVALHHDDAIYKNPEVFDPFRFAALGEGEESAKHQFAATSAEYLSFGHGRHACPGRFFAAVELKTMLAHIVMTYDVKLEENTARPQSMRVGSVVAANSTAKVMFRRRTRQEGGLGH